MFSHCFVRAPKCFQSMSKFESGVYLGIEIADQEKWQGVEEEKGEDAVDIPCLVLIPVFSAVDVRNLKQWVFHHH